MTWRRRLSSSTGERRWKTSVHAKINCNLFDLFFCNGMFREFLKFSINIIDFGLLLKVSFEQMKRILKKIS